MVYPLGTANLVYLLALKDDRQNPTICIETAFRIHVSSSMLYQDFLVRRFYTLGKSADHSSSELLVGASDGNYRLVTPHIYQDLVQTKFFP